MYFMKNNNWFRKHIDKVKKLHNFNEYVIEKIMAKDYDAVVNYETIKDADYALPTPEHYLPLLSV